MGEALSVAVVGGGIGGLTAALSLHRAGLDVHVYEQAGSVSEIGAGIQVSPNATRVLHGLGLGDEPNLARILAAVGNEQPSSAAGCDERRGRAAAARPAGDRPRRSGSRDETDPRARRGPLRRASLLS